MEEKIKHTFVIVAYKEYDFLEECIKSLKDQSVTSEILISTSTPSQFLERIASKYKISLRVNEKSEGIASDWSFAYNQAKTRYVTLAHQDDLYLPDYTKTCLARAEKFPNNLITFTDYNELFINKLRHNNLNLIIKRIILFPFYVWKKNISSPFWKSKMLLFGSPICCPCVIYNKKNIGDFEFDISFLIGLDWEAWIRLSRMNGDFIYIKKRLMTHRIHEESETTMGIKSNRRRNEDIILFKRLWPEPLVRILSKLYSVSYESNS